MYLALILVTEEFIVCTGQLARCSDAQGCALDGESTYEVHKGSNRYQVHFPEGKENVNGNT